MNYICISKTKLEERIKELKEREKILKKAEHYLREGDKQELEILQELLKESIDAEEFFNAGRKEEDWSDVAAGDLCYKYEDCFEYTKTLNT